MGVGEMEVGEMALTWTINTSSLEEEKKMLYSDSYTGFILHCNSY